MSRVFDFYGLGDFFLLPKMMQNGARFDDIGIDNFIKHVQALFARMDETAMAQQSQVLGKIGFGQAGDF